MISSIGVAIARVTMDSRARSPRAGLSGTAEKDGNQRRRMGRGRNLKKGGRCVAVCPGGLATATCYPFSFKNWPFNPPLFHSALLASLSLYLPERATWRLKIICKLLRKETRQRSCDWKLFTCYHLFNRFAATERTTNRIRTAVTWLIFLWVTTMFPP